MNTLSRNPGSAPVSHRPATLYIMFVTAPIMCVRVLTMFIFNIKEKVCFTEEGQKTGQHNAFTLSDDASRSGSLCTHIPLGMF